MVKSPCTNICTIARDKDVCLGCGRTSKEIKSWIFKTNKEKMKILNKLKINKIKIAANEHAGF